MKTGHFQNRILTKVTARNTDPRIRIAAFATALLAIASVGFFAAYAGIPLLGHGTGTPAAAAAAVVPRQDAFAGTLLVAKAAIVVDLTDGSILYQQHPDAQLPLASLTKVPLVLAVSGALSPRSEITIPQHDTPDGAPARLISGSLWRVQDLIDYTLVASSNEGAQELARAADSTIHASYPQSPTSDATLWRMNDIAHSLGLSQTYFLNPTGLDISDTQAGAFGSARDVARLFAYAASTSPSLFESTTDASVSRGPIGGAMITGANTDEALPAIPGLIMGKTGYTDLAGGNLAVVFDVGLAHPVVAVVLGSSRDGRFSDMKELVSRTQKAVTLAQQSGVQ